MTSVQGMHASAGSCKPVQRRVFRRALRWAYWRGLGLFRRTFQHRNHVFRFDPNSPPPRVVTGLTIERIDAMTSQLREAMVTAFGEKAVEKDERELASGAVLWVGRISGRVVGSRCSRQGRCFQNWLVPLEPNDIVIFRGRTLAASRGQGIAPAMIRHIAGLAQCEGANVYVDCRVYNKPSIRSIEKAGFVRIGTMKPMSRIVALGEINLDGSAGSPTAFQPNGGRV